jgi:hypothetical protein
MPKAPPPSVEIFPVILTVPLKSPCKSIPLVVSPQVTIFVAYVPGELMAVPESVQTAKLLILKSTAAQNKKHWDKLKNFLIREFLLNKF